MSLKDFQRTNAQPIAFDSEAVKLVEPHESGAGVRVTVEIGGEVTDLHIVGDYEDILDQIRLDGFMLALKRTRQEVAAEDAPF